MNVLILFLIDHVVYTLSENSENVHHNFLESKVRSSNYLTVQKSKDTEKQNY